VTEELVPVRLPKRKPLEKDVEAYLVGAVKRLGGKCWKFVSPNNRGVCDRICVLPGNRVWFVELKRDRTGRLSSNQKRFFETLRALGVTNQAVLKGKEEVSVWIEARRAERAED